MTREYITKEIGEELLAIGKRLDEIAAETGIEIISAAGYAGEFPGYVKGQGALDSPDEARDAVESYDGFPRWEENGIMLADTTEEAGYWSPHGRARRADADELAAFRKYREEHPE